MRAVEGKKVNGRPMEVGSGGGSFLLDRGRQIYSKIPGLRDLSHGMHPAFGRTMRVPGKPGGARRLTVSSPALVYSASR